MEGKRNWGQRYMQPKGNYLLCSDYWKPGRGADLCRCLGWSPGKCRRETDYLRHNREIHRKVAPFPPQCSYTQYFGGYTKAMGMYNKVGEDVHDIYRQKCYNQNNVRSGDRTVGTNGGGMEGIRRHENKRGQEGTRKLRGGNEFAMYQQWTLSKEEVSGYVCTVCTVALEL